MIKPLPFSSPRRGEVTIAAMVFDTFGTVCDFYQPLKRGFEALARRKNVSCDAGRMAIDWRTAYVISTFTQAVEESDFVPLRDMNRHNLEQLLARSFASEVTEPELEELTGLWSRLDPWPDTVGGLYAIREFATIAPLSNGNFSDMVGLARHARLPWDVILGSSLAGYYKPHPDTYLKSVAALNLQPEQVCMVAAHQQDLAYAAGHGMQTAFVKRPDEFGGPVKPENPEPGVLYMDAAEIHPEGDWTYIADDFLDLARQVQGVQRARRMSAYGIS